MSFLLDGLGNAIHRNRRVIGGTTVKPGPGLSSIVRNRNVPSGGEIGGFIGVDPLVSYSVTRDTRMVRGGRLTYTAGTHEGSPGGYDTGDPAQLSWWVDAEGNARLISLALGNVDEADTKFVSRGVGKVGLDQGDSFVVGTGVRLDAGDFIEMPEVAADPLATPSRRQAKFFKGSTGTSVAVGLNNNIADGSTVIVAVYTSATAARTHTTPTNWTVGKTETQATMAGDDRITIFYRRYATGGAFSETFQWSADSAYRVLVVEVDSLLTTTPVDQAVSAEGGTGQQWSFQSEASDSKVNFIGNSNFTVYKPAGAQVGDLILVAINVYGETVTPACSTPSGWVERVAYDYATRSRTYVFEHFVLTGDPASWTFPVTGSGFKYAQLAACSWRPGNVLDAIWVGTDSTTPYVGGSPSGISWLHSLGIYIVANTNSGGSLTPDTAGLTERSDHSTALQLWIGDIETEPGDGGWSVSGGASAATATIALVYYAATEPNTQTASSGATAALAQAKEYCFSVMACSSENLVTSVTGPTGGFSNISVGDFVSEKQVLVGQDKIPTDTAVQQATRQFSGDSVLGWIGAMVTFKSITLSSKAPSANFARLFALEGADTLTDLAVVRSDGSTKFLSVAGSNHALWSTSHTDVDTADAKNDGDVLTWDATAGKWKATASGLTTHEGAADPHTGYVLESLVDAVGDLIVGSADNVVARLAKGTDAQVLEVLASETLDLRWASRPFSLGATVMNPVTGTTLMIWRAPFACTVTNVRTHFKGGTSIVCNARKNQASNHLASNYTNSTANAWGDGGTVQNATYAAGDDLEIMFVTINGAVTEASIQVDFTRP
jgi:hypothetical protein